MSTITPQEKLFAIYNLDRTNNGLPVIDATDFIVGDPEVYSGSRSPKNTRVYLTPKPSSSNIGRITLYYNRIDFATITTLMVTKGAAVNVVDLLPQINEELGITLVAADISNTTLPTTGPFTLTATAVNLVYTGSTNVAYAP